MPNATVRANARTLPEATNRRAVLGAVLAAGALGATAALPSIASGAPVLSAVDRRVLDLWGRYTRMRAALERIADQRNAAQAQMSDWARPGPKYVLVPGGDPRIMGIDCSATIGGVSVGSPQVPDLDQRLARASGWVLARPSVDDLYEQSQTNIKSIRELMEALRAHDARMNEQKAEDERVGYSRLNKRSETGWSKVVDLEDAIIDHTEASVLALGASLVIGIQGNDEQENVLAAYRASLRALRPQLVGAIADDADRVLAESEEDA
jgi:hypothetical protein